MKEFKILDNPSNMHKDNILITIEPIMVSVIDKDTRKLGESFLSNVPIEQVINDIKTGIFPPVIKKSRWERTESKLVVWSGTIKSLEQRNQIEQYNGLICFRLSNLTDKRASFLYDSLMKDPYTFILLTDLQSKGLRVIVKSSSQNVNEHEVFFQQLLAYYQSTYELTNQEFSTKSRWAYEACYTFSDSTIFYNPESNLLERQPGFEMSQLDQVLTVEPANCGTTIKISQHEPLLIDMPDTSVPASSENESKQASTTTHSKTPYLLHLCDLEHRIDDATKREIVTKTALISREGTGIIWPGTINLIQGKYGQHKSRLAEMFASLMLAGSESQVDKLGFDKLPEQFLLCYLDTERNVEEEFPEAIQRIRSNAGYNPAETLADFRFTSLKITERSNRIEAIEAYLQEVRQSSSKHIFVILDVVTDCVGSFNDERQSMKLMDSIGNFCELYNSTFLLVIHENPSSEKARGHIGTEAANKANTVMQISTVSDDNEIQLIQLHFHKLRRGKKPNDIYFRINDATKGFMLADEGLIEARLRRQQKSVNQDEIVAFVMDLLKDGRLEKGKLINQICQAFNRGYSTVRDRIKLLSTEPVLYTTAGEAVKLVDQPEGQKHFLYLECLN